MKDMLENIVKDMEKKDSKIKDLQDKLTKEQRRSYLLKKTNQELKRNLDLEQKESHFRQQIDKLEIEVSRTLVELNNERRKLRRITKEVESWSK